MSSNLNKKTNVFSGRNFRLVFLGALVSELGGILYNFAVSFYILEITNNSASLQGLYLALCGIAMLIFTPVGGVIGDRFHKAKIMFACDYIRGGMIIIATILMLLFRQPSAHIIILFALGILGNIVAGIFTPAANSLFPHIVQEELLQQANAYFSIKSSLESILGILLAGVLYAVLPIHTLFFFVGICFVASGVSEMLIRYDHQPSKEHLTIKLALQDMGDGISYLKTKKAILAFIGSILFINFFFAPITSNFIPFFIKTDLTSAPSYLFDKVFTPELWSSVFTVCFGISSLLGASVLSAKAQEENVGAKVSVRILAIAFVIISLTIAYWLFVERGTSLNAFLIFFSAAILLVGFIISFVNIPVSTVMMRIIDKDKLSKVTSITSIGTHGMIPIASLLAGLVLDSFGSTVLLLVCSIGFMITALVLLFSKEVKKI